VTAIPSIGETCALCGRPSIVCRRDDAEHPVGRVVCDALHAVLDLERFRRPSDPFLTEQARVVGLDGRRSDSVRLSIKTIALLREWRRSLLDERYRPAVRLTVCEAIATELVRLMLVDLVDVDLDATIGDRCPQCRREKSGEEGARDYWCQSCMDAARKEVER
jgi:hypothetical protein